MCMRGAVSSSSTKLLIVLLMALAAAIRAQTPGDSASVKAPVPAGAAGGSPECVPSMRQVIAGGVVVSAVCPPTPPLWEEPQFTKMLSAFRQQLDKRHRALLFEMNSQIARLLVQDPDKPENVDAYEYFNGRLRDPSPVKNFSVVSCFATFKETFMGMEEHKLQDCLFDWTHVSFERIPALVSEALAIAKLEGGKASNLTIEGSPGDDDGGWFKRRRRGPLVTMSVYIEGARHDATVTADTMGHVQEVKID